MSIVMPTLNGGTLTGELLEAVRAQAGDFTLDIIAVDSGSTDGTIARLLRARAQVVSVAPERFNHGAVRNMGLARAKGEFAVLLVQDAVPASPGWLQALIAPLVEDGAIAGSFARQLPAADASRLTAHHLRGWAAAQPAARVIGPLSPAAFAAMQPSERHLMCAFDNVCSCIRLAVWRQHPFRHTPIAEDLEWGRDVLLAGYKLAYAPDAAVRHSHERSLTYELHRTYLVHQRLQALFGLATVPTLPSLLRSIGATVPRHLQLALGEKRGRVRQLARGAALGVAWPLGQYLGARSARDGREWLRPHHV